jgi:hypothetical protein
MHTVSLGAYVLGALEPAERAEFEAHLAGCPVCQAELVRLAPLTGLLNQISPEDFEDHFDEVTPEGEPIEPPFPAVAAAPARNRRYWLVAAAAVLALLIGVGGVLGYQALRRPVAVASVTWSAQDPASGMHADAQLINHSWGTEVRLRLDDSPSGKPCKLVVRDRDGGREVAGWWTAQYHPQDVIPGSTSVDVRDIARLQIVTDDDQVLVDIPAPGAH